jgi:hypothetical protein
MAARKNPRRAAGASKKKHKSTSRSKRARKTKVRPLASQLLEPAAFQAALRDSIENDIAARVEAHQREVRATRASVRLGDQPPLMLLSHGDSWFDYPCDGNTYTPSSTSDIIAQLRKVGKPAAKILNLSHYGDATTDEMGLAKQQRLIKALKDSKNWLNGAPDAILFSGGGNDIAGDPFCIYLNYKDSGSQGLNAERFAGRLASIRASYLDLFAFRDRYASKVPIFGHGYDNARPMQSHPPCAGPWIRPALGFTGWSDQEGREILLDALTQFRRTLDALEADPRHFDFTRVHTEGTLNDNDWANELHPHPPGFGKLAQIFLSALQHRFPGRI